MLRSSLARLPVNHPKQKILGCPLPLPLTHHIMGINQLQIFRKLKMFLLSKLSLAACQANYIQFQGTTAEEFLGSLPVKQYAVTLWHAVRATPWPLARQNEGGSTQHERIQSIDDTRYCLNI